MGGDMKRCIFCMEPLEEGQETCPVCGKTSWEYQWEKNWLRPQTLLNERYLIGSVRGEGAFGITYLGFDTVLSHRVAVKELFLKDGVTREENTQNVMKITEEQRNTFLEEAAMLAGKYDIPGICSVRDYFCANGTAYIVQEYLPGGALKEYLKNQPHHRLEADKLNRIFQPVLQGLARIHGEGIIHCDISPDNLMFDGNGGLKLIDFGAARQKLQPGDERILKEGYAPPEQYQDGKLLGPWTDLYALCAVMYQALGGRKPPGASRRMLKDSLEPLEDLVKVPQHVGRAVMQGLSLDIRKRYFSAVNLMEQLNMDTGGADMLLGAARAVWGDVWLAATAEQAGDFQRSKRRRVTGRLLKRAGMGAAVLCGTALLVCGSLYAYVRTHPEEVFRWRVKRAQEYERKHPDCEIIDVNSPGYEEILLFVETYGIKDDNDGLDTSYVIPKKKVQKMGLVSNAYHKFYLDRDTLKTIIAYYLDMDLEKKSGKSISDYNSSIIVKNGKLKRINISCVETTNYQFVSNGTDSTLKVSYDVVDERVMQVKLSASVEDCRTMLKEILPYIVPETYLTDEEVDDIINQAQSSPENEGVWLSEHAKYSFLSVKKRTLDAFSGEDQKVKMEFSISAGGVNIFW
ncbi:serine/threonine protein kinase [Ruminococcus sp. OA3]|uniref:serine/threonine protein kinase n=1 Tax=Ruminococcus sp. OA3 TaxID=2914164 RepID=UPI001F067BD1|nr:serine/threonine-protein kinase [Ruminococcus sp. OA3]MCH1983893.1 serine/threonine protein kinase [Ruminococcus sp. OA3]